MSEGGNGKYAKSKYYIITLGKTSHRGTPGLNTGTTEDGETRLSFGIADLIARQNLLEPGAGKLCRKTTLARSLARVISMCRDRGKAVERVQR